MEGPAQGESHPLHDPVIWLTEATCWVFDDSGLAADGRRSQRRILAFAFECPTRQRTRIAGFRRRIPPPPAVSESDANPQQDHDAAWRLRSPAIRDASFADCSIQANSAVRQSRDDEPIALLAVEEAIRAVVDHDDDRLALLAPDADDLYVWTRDYGSHGVVDLVVPPGTAEDWEQIGPRCRMAASMSPSGCGRCRRDDPTSRSNRGSIATSTGAGDHGSWISALRKRLEHLERWCGSFARGRPALPPSIRGAVESPGRATPPAIRPARASTR